MKLYLILIVLMLMLVPVNAYEWDCVYVPTLNESEVYQFHSVNFTYVGLTETLAFPGNFLDAVYRVDPPNINFTTYYLTSGFGGWSKVDQPDFSIETMLLFWTNKSSVSFCTWAVDPVTPTPTPTPTTTIPGGPSNTTPSDTDETINQSGTLNEVGGNLGNYSAYNANNTGSPYSHISSGAIGFNEVLRGFGYCIDRVCTADDVKKMLKTYINFIWWLSYLAVLARYKTLKPCPGTDTNGCNIELDKIKESDIAAKQKQRKKETENNRLHRLIDSETRKIQRQTEVENNKIQRQIESETKRDQRKEDSRTNRGAWKTLRIQERAARVSEKTSLKGKKRGEK